MTLERIGLDPSKAVFTLHGVGQDETAVLRRSMRRAAMEAFFARLPPTLVAPEACGGPHRWGRRRAGLGRTVQLIPPHHVKPFVKRGKNDRNDAGAISEAAARPAEQQAEAVVLSARAPLVRQRTPLVNAVRGHAAAFGIVAAKNISRLPALLEVWRPRRRCRLPPSRCWRSWAPDEAAAQGQPGQPAAGRGARHRPDRRSEPGTRD